MVLFLDSTRNGSTDFDETFIDLFYTCLKRLQVTLTATSPRFCPSDYFDEASYFDNYWTYQSTS